MFITFCPGINLLLAVWSQKEIIENLSSTNVVHTTTKLVGWTRTTVKCTKMKNAHAKLLFSLLNMQICEVLVVAVVVIVIAEATVI